MKIAIISDGMNLNTGYGKIALNLAKEMAINGIDVFGISLSLQGNPVTYHDAESGLTFPIYSGMVFENNNTNVMDNAIKEIKPDALVTIRDPVTFAPQGFQYAFNLEKWKGKIKRYSYIPIMNPFIPTLVFNQLVKNSDYVFTFTDTAENMLVRAGMPYNMVSTVPLGYDPLIFKKSEPRLKMDGKNIFGFIGLNNDKRKMSLSLLLALKEYLKDDPTAMLYFHNSLNRQYPLVSRITELGLNGHIIAPMERGVTKWNPFAFLSESQMASLYSSFTATVSMSCTEGFNMPFLESMACGTPAVGVNMPFYNWSNQIIKVPSFISEAQGDIGWISDPKEFAEGMHKATQTKIDTTKLEKYTWTNTFKSMLKVIK